MLKHFQGKKKVSIKLMCLSQVEIGVVFFLPIFMLRIKDDQAHKGSQFLSEFRFQLDLKIAMALFFLQILLFISHRIHGYSLNPTSFYSSCGICVCVIFDQCGWSASKAHLNCLSPLSIIAYAFLNLFISVVFIEIHVQGSEI